MTTPTVVFHIDAHGNIANYADGDVRVIWVSDMTPSDRLYRTDPGPIPDGLIDGELGHQFDGSPAAARLERIIKAEMGQRHLCAAPATGEQP